MSRELIMEELKLFGERLKLFFEQAKDAPRMMWEGTSGTANLGTRALLIITALLIAAGLIAYLVTFIRAKWRSKLSMLFWTVIILLFLAVLFFFGTRNVAAAVELPEADTLVMGDQEVRVYPQYSLARGVKDPVFPLVRAYWQLRDDVVTWEAVDGLLVQLTGLHSLPGEGEFTVSRLGRDEGWAMISLEKELGEGGPQNADMRHSYLEIQIFFNSQLEEMPWYGEAGHIWEESAMHYTVQENAGDRLILREQNDGWINEGGVLPGLSEARQIGPDVVYIVYRLDHYRWQLGDTTFYNQDLDKDETLHAEMLELIDALFDGSLHLLRNLSEEEADALLPEKLMDFPVYEASANGGFILPCTKLLDMIEAEDGTAYLRLIGTGPDGGDVLYTLQNGGTMYLAGEREHYAEWRDAYESGKKTPDEAMSAFLGCPVVALDSGWLINPGNFYNPDIDAPIQNYYYLTMEPVNP